MRKLYLKQAWELLKQNRLFSTLYIVGTALAIAMTMMMAVIYYVRLAPVYPEERRGTTLYMGGLKLSQTFDNGGWAWWTNGYSHRAVTEWFRPLEDAAVVSGYYNAWSGAAYVQRPDGREDEPVKVRLSGLIASRMESRRAEMGIHLAEYGALGEPAAHLHRRTDRAGDGVDMPLPGQRLGVHYTGQLCHPCAGRCRLRRLCATSSAAMRVTVPMLRCKNIYVTP